MALITGENKRFLFLQGPHGPFFWRLGQMLERAGAQVWRVGFNAGDRAFWFSPKTYIGYCGTLNDWAETLRQTLHDKSITDIVLYGDTRPVHAQAAEMARQMGIRIHVFEEGYLRPYWVSYERDGSNGNSALMQLSVDQMRETLADADLDIPQAPAHWGDMRQHVFYGALYHWFVMLRNGHYRKMQRHRALDVKTEFALYFMRLLGMPFYWLSRVFSTLRIKRGGYPYHIALLQLEHDASFQAHSPFSKIDEFIEVIIEGFAKGAPAHHHLVLKAHPLENGQTNIRRLIKNLARQHGVEGRCHYVRGGKLAQLLDHARSAVTVNSTAGQQVLWRGIPLKVFGAAVYNKPEFVSSQPLHEFFSLPTTPDTAAYRDYRRYLLETSQIAGGFYAAKGRRQLLRQVVDLMLHPHDPYEALEVGKAAPRQQLRVIP
ncbi:capsule biosynthesis protein [Nereida ignava]|uniref:Capsule polysaccharide biosynthesis protein n=1 Tax=Nereida ignava TaxID=282199 RepID=A0A0U1NII0_9RHOB|nr:capsular biosynthesis protein [Nereida ignava]CRK74505.1 Capsule polysaccharide biosynthesis protein [Nereida ignava]SFJ19732.1 capsular polysaccharide export protein [Nereida ignava DSM 16309]